jgi:hypothetical protein
VQCPLGVTKGQSHLELLKFYWNIDFVVPFLQLSVAISFVPCGANTLIASEAVYFFEFIHVSVVLAPIQGP